MVTQLQMSGQEVSMEVSQKNVADLDSELLGVGEVLLNVPLRIDHDCTLAGFVRDKVRRVRKTTQVVLLEEHSAYCKTNA
jgi:imidazole glycerol phosphate synthase subunit HisF